MHVKFYYMYKKLVNCIMYHEIRSIIKITFVYMYNTKPIVQVLMTKKCQKCFNLCEFM